MHEMSLCEGILQVLQSEAAKQGFSKVKTVRLEIGALSSVETYAMRFGFDAVMRNSIADSAVLDIIDVPGAAWCTQCKKSHAVNQRFQECPDCGLCPLQITGGEEMRIKELEVE